MDIDWEEAKLSCISSMKAQLKKIEQRIEMARDGAEQSALIGARVELIQAMFSVYLMTE